MDDQKIVQLFWQRDQNAIEKVEFKYGARLHLLAMGILRNHEDAEESVNDTYLKAWNTIPPQKPNFLYAYLAKICRFISFGKLDWKNAKKRSAKMVELTTEMELCIPSKYSEIDVDRAAIASALNSFLKTLSEEKRLIFIRRYWYADSISDISKRYGIGESKVKTTLYRTRNQLKTHLEREGVIL